MKSLIAPQPDVTAKVFLVEYGYQLDLFNHSRATADGQGVEYTSVCRDFGGSYPIQNIADAVVEELVEAMQLVENRLTSPAVPSLDGAKRKWLSRGWKREAEKLLREVTEVRLQYHDLLMAVERVFDGETRHQTAKRYIEEAENRARSVSECKDATGG